MRYALLCVSIFASCSSDPAPRPNTQGQPVEKGDPLVPDAASVPLCDYLMFDTPLAGTLTADTPFCGYLLSTRAGAEITVSASATSGSPDLTLFLFGPAEGALFTNPPISTADDTDRRDPAFTLTLPADGRYLAVVGTFDGQGQGGFDIEASCEGEACATPELAGAVCPLALVDDIVACVDDLYADPESAPATLQEAVELCADAEPLADAIDAACMGDDGAVFCGVDYGTFWQAINPSCRDAAFFAVRARDCVFGAVFRDLFELDSVVVLADTQITTTDGLDTLDRDRLLIAVQAVHPDADSPDAALASVDGGIVRRVEIADRARRTFTAFEYGAGDNSFGRIFEATSTTVVADIGDGDLYDCTVPPGVAGAACESNDDCVGVGELADLSCNAIVEGIGTCVALDSVAGEGNACGDEACAAGLYCAGLSEGPAGICVAPWMVAAFEATPFLSIPDNDAAGLTETLVVHGLGTVDMDVELHAVVRHPDAGELTVTLINPATTEVAVYEGTSSGADLLLDLAVAAFPGDESVNGIWQLRVVDNSAGGVGFLESWRLVLRAAGTDDLEWGSDHPGDGSRQGVVGRLIERGAHRVVVARLFLERQLAVVRVELGDVVARDTLSHAEHGVRREAQHSRLDRARSIRVQGAVIDRHLFGQELHHARAAVVVQHLVLEQKPPPVFLELAREGEQPVTIGSAHRRIYVLAVGDEVTGRVVCTPHELVVAGEEDAERILLAGARGSVEVAAYGAADHLTSSAVSVALLVYGNRIPGERIRRHVQETDERLAVPVPRHTRASLAGRLLCHEEDVLAVVVSRVRAQVHCGERGGVQPFGEALTRRASLPLAGVLTSEGSHDARLVLGEVS